MMERVKWMVCFGLLFFVLTFCVNGISAVSSVRQELVERAGGSEELEARQQAEAKARRQASAKEEVKGESAFSSEQRLAISKLPDDTSSQFTVGELRISGNTLISTEELLADMPLVYNASDKSLDKAASSSLYDIRGIHDVILQPGRGHEVSMRTIQGFTQYILSVYRSYDYSGIYVYVPREAIKDDKLVGEVLPIEVLEVSVSDVRITYYDVDRNEKPDGFLRRSVIEQWSPVEVGRLANRRKLDEFINLLNLNPDRYISARVSEGKEARTLSVGYDVYEADPWHWYAQLDNSGSDDVKWSPRFGLTNTNVTGIDDRLDVIYRAPVDDIQNNYSFYGSYEFPVLTPRLRLRVFGGYSEFDSSSEGASGLDFFGTGSFIGGMLRYNLHQQDGWFYDITSSLSYEESKVTSSLLNSILGSEVRMTLWGLGLDVHKSDDISSTSIRLDRRQSIHGSDDAAFAQARAGSDSDFNIYSVSASHSRYLDPDKVQRFRGSFRWIQPNERLVPSRLTTFGGLYTVRGYKENEVVADGGIIASVQYEYDLVKREEAGHGPSDASTPKPFVRRVAPLVFFDFGRARMKHHVTGENDIEELNSAGVGLAVSLGDNFEGSVYYGHPLRSTDDTDKNNGRWNVSLLMRW